MMKRWAKAGISLLMAGLVGGCAFQQKKVDEQEYSGFLSDYSKLQAFDRRTALRWVDPKIHQYRKLMIDPLVLYPAPQASNPERRQLLTQITQYMNQQLAQKLPADLLSDQAGDDVLRVRPAITAVLSATEGFQLREAIPLRLIYSGVEAALGARDKVVAVYLEMELLDSQSGEFIGAIVRKGHSEQEDNDQLTFADVKPILDQWLETASQNIEQGFRQTP